MGGSHDTKADTLPFNCMFDFETPIVTVEKHSRIIIKEKLYLRMKYFEPCKFKGSD